MHILHFYFAGQTIPNFTHDFMGERGDTRQMTSWVNGVILGRSSCVVLVKLSTADEDKAVSHCIIIDNWLCPNKLVL